MLGFVRAIGIYADIVGLFPGEVREFHAEVVQMQACHLLGLTEPRGKQIFEKAQQMTLADVKAAQEKWVKGRKYVYGILGDIQDLDLNYLKTLGPIQTVTQEEIFGY